MASLHCCARPVQAVLGVHRPLHRSQSSFLAFQVPRRIHFNFSFHNAASVQLRQRLVPISASNSDPSDKSSEASGPPLATILAGVLVFCAVCWMVGSIAIWLISLVTNVTPSK